MCDPALKHGRSPRANSHLSRVQARGTCSSVSSGLPFTYPASLFFPVALYAVKVRAEAMQKASEAVPSGMLSVIGRQETNYRFACLEARKHCESLGIENPVCAVSNYLFPDSRVIAGHLQVLLPNNCPAVAFNVLWCKTRAFCSQKLPAA